MTLSFGSPDDDMKQDLSLDEVKAVFTKFLVERKHRKTPERFAILEQVYAYDGHFNADILHQAMSREYRVSLATIYNTLELLLECRLIVKHQFGDQIAQYEKTFGASADHHHMVCTRCGKIREFTDKKIKQAVQNKKFVYFENSHYSLYLYGLCRKCKTQIEKSKKQK